MTSQPSWWQNAKPFVNGGLAGCIGLSIMHPVDLVKVRLQLGQGSTLHILKTVIREEGLLAFYNGWSAQMIRQLSYGTVRLGLFQWLRDHVSERDASGKLLPLPIYKSMACGLASGVCGAIVGNPADVSLIRMQADRMLPEHERRSYRNVFQAFYRIASEEGLVTLWRGCGPTMLRAAAINASSLACYDQTKVRVDRIMGTSSGPVAVLCGATSAGVVGAATSMPFDFIKTQVQQMKPLPDGSMPFTGMTDCTVKMFQQRGISGFYVGFPVYCVRICPAIAIVFFALETIIKTEKKWGIF